MNPTLHSIGLLVLRIGSGGMLFFAHGLPKLGSFGERWSTFANPIGLGSEASLALVVFAEVVCALLVVLGLWTRLATVPILIFMMVAAFVQHAQDPWGRKELPLLYAVCFATLLCTGPGRYSFDARLGFGLRRRR